MSKCIYCGQKAGFLRSKHKECEEKNIAMQTNIINLIESSIVNGSQLDKLQSEVNKLANEGYINENGINGLYTSGYDKAVDNFLDDGILTIEEEDKLQKFKKELDIGQEILDKNGSLQKAGKAAIIRDITEGKTPELRLNIVGTLPFNFQKDEKIIWLFQSVEFYEQYTKTVYEGGSVGASIRVAKGLYFRTSSFKGHPVQTQEMKFIDTGMFVITNKYIYFSSSLKNFRIEFKKIITIDPYEDAIGLQKDGVSSKPQIFKNLDGRFTYNVISNLNKLS